MCREGGHYVRDPDVQFHGDRSKYSDANRHDELIFDPRNRIFPDEH